MKVCNDPRLAWCMALDTGVRSPLGSMLEDLANGGDVQHGIKSGAGAAHGVEYASVYACIRRLEQEQPSVAAVGHVLCHPSTEGGNVWLDAAAQAVTQKAVAVIPNWSDGRAWKPGKRERVGYLVRVALLERRLNLSRMRPAWRPDQIGEAMAEWYGMPIVTRKWHQDWKPLWFVIQVAIDTMETDAMQPITEAIDKIIRNSRVAA